MKVRSIDPVRLTSARHRAGYPTQAKAARDLGWSRSKLNNYERGISEPGIAEIRSLAALYVCSVEDFWLEDET